MKLSLLKITLFAFFQLFLIEKNAAFTASASVPYQFKNHIVTDTTDYDEEGFYDSYKVDKFDESMIRIFSHTAFVLIALAFLTFGITLIGSTILGIVAFTIASPYRKKYKTIPKEHQNYSRIRRLVRLSNRVFAIAVIPVILLLLLAMGVIITENSNSLDSLTLSFGILSVLVFLILEGVIFKGRDI